MEGINFQSEKDDQKKFEKNNRRNALNALYAKKCKIYTAYVSKYNSNREKQVILIMIPYGEGWHYLAVKKEELLRGITSKCHGEYYFLNRFHSFATENKCKSQKVCDNKDFCNVVMPSEDTKILKFT